MPKGCRRGSSPHTRGNFAFRVIELRVGRIIPAYAGQLRLRPIARPVGTDHPRIRGATGRSTLLPASPIGSSPHTRGNSGHPDRLNRFERIIPAYAGQLPSPPAKKWKPADHPRIRGATAFMVGDFATGFGSSPHTRGNSPTSVRMPPGGRIIPAYAGQLLSMHVGHTVGADHPRIRGATALACPNCACNVGSSPH